MTVFNIGPQQAANINNVGGDQHIAGDQHGIVVPPSVHHAVDRLRAELLDTSLARSDAAQAEAAVDDVSRQLRRPAPDKTAIARSLVRLTELLQRTGSLVAAGVSLLGPLRTVAEWLGSLGTPVINALAGR